MPKLYKSKLLSLTICLLLIFIITTSFTLHKYYVSLTTVEHNIKNNSFEITLQIFTDDLELTLNNFYKKPFNLGTSKENNETNEAINTYVSEKMNLKINGKTTILKMLGKEFEDDMTLIYFEVTGVKNLKTIKITNKLLFETFDDQQHIIKVKSKNLHKNLLFSKNKFKEMIKIY